MKARAHVYVSGRVQGVFFRAETANLAHNLGLTGWVRNLSDGRVEALFEGEKEKVEEAVAFCRARPIRRTHSKPRRPMGRVDGRIPRLPSNPLTRKNLMCERTGLLRCSGGVARLAMLGRKHTGLIR